MLFSVMVVLIYIPTNRYIREFPFLHTVSSIYCLYVFDDGHSDLFEVTSHYSFDFVAVVESLSCVRLCIPMDCSMPSFTVFYHLPELTQTHVH